MTRRLYVIAAGVVVLTTAVISIPFVTSAFAQNSAVAEVGQTAPDFTMTGIDGKDFKLSDLTGKGKNVALMFDRANW